MSEFKHTLIDGLLIMSVYAGLFAALYGYLVWLS